MSDYLGPNQTRVLDSTNRYFEEIIYQKKKPPLSCEVNLNGKISAERDQDILKYIGPSGWSAIGQLKNGVSESSCCTGDVVCSSAYAANSFKLISLNRGIETKSIKALVNGWEILVQGTNSSDENNIITLPVPPSKGSRVNFVFLEVWRKLISTTDTIYKYGNFLYGGSNYSNDLVDPAINIETSLRIQIQYRIRVTSDINIKGYPNGFDPLNVFVQGPLSSPNSAYNFSAMPDDIGLWRAGLGDSASQTDLQTVDGYTYAIPLFAVHRRNTCGNGTYRYDQVNRTNGSGLSLSDYLLGKASDRPDNLYNNWVVSTDILDLRHRISPNENFKEISENGFKKLIRGQVRSVMVEDTKGEDLFGTILVQADAVGSTTGLYHGGSDQIATGTAVDGIRRVFSNALVNQSDTIILKTVNDKTVGTIGGVWSTSDAVTIDISAYPVGSTIISVQEVYISTGPLTPTTHYTLSTMPTGSLITIPGTSSLLSTSTPIHIDCTIQFASGLNGFKYVPEQMLEFRNEDSTMAYALRDADIRVRTSAPVVATDGTHFNMVSNHGGYEGESYDFGHQMTFNALGNGTVNVSFSRNIEGFPILGVIKARVSGDVVDKTILGVVRTATTYTVTLDSSVVPNANIELQLYTGCKFFDTNKQGRGIIETYEMTELTTTGAGGTDFSIDSTSKCILAIASRPNRNGLGIAYVGGTETDLLTNNSELPTDSTKSVLNFSFSAGQTGLIEIPVLMKSAISSTEGYTFFYNRVPYQGLLDSTVVGAIESEGPSLTTTAGSGAITNFTYSTGKAIFNDTSTVQGLGTEWLSLVGSDSSYVISSDATPSKEYIIDRVYSNTFLYLESVTDMSSLPAGDSYTITAKDQPYFVARNVIDRLPTLHSYNDASGRNEAISTAVSEAMPVLNTKVTSEVQGITELPPNDVIIGVNTADRGRSTVQIPEEYAPIGVNSLGLKFEKLDASGQYQKSYQTYVLNKENTGELYLMVVGSETDNTSKYRYLNEKSVKDSVDIFQLPGRPLTNRRNG
jgi:hypothetical protein